MASNNDYIDLPAIAASNVEAPASGVIRLADIAGTLKQVNPDGTTSPIGGGTGGSGTVTFVGSSDGSMGVSFPTTVPDLTVLMAPLIQASWPLGICRIFAVDLVNGNDLNKGFADPATNSATDYAIACAAAGLVAKKTFAGLSKIFPRSGAQRTAEVVAANGGVGGGVSLIGTYGESLESAIGGASGYAILAVRGTGTNTTANCTAFDGSVADCTYQGAITAPGMNAAGYVVIGTPTTTVIQLQKVGGTAAAFSAEAAASMPLGASLRGDANGTRNQNIRRQVVKVTGTDTLTFPTALPTLPVAGDVFYIEQPGVLLTSIFLGSSPQQSSSVLSDAFTTLSGLATTGGMNFQGGLWRLSFCWSGAQIAVQAAPSWSGLVSYTHPVRGTITPGSSRSTTFFSASNCGAVLNSAMHTVTTYSIAACQTHSAANGLVIGTTTTITNLLQGSAAVFGGTTAIPSVPPRILNGALNLNNISVGLGQIEINSPSSCVVITGSFCCLDLSIGLANTHLTGAGAAGFGLNVSGSVTPIPICSRIPIYGGVLPAFTGSLGDVGAGAGQVIAWAQSANGFVDVNGNLFLSPASAGNGPVGYKFSGKYFGGAGPDFTYVADSPPSLLTVNLNARIGYPALGNMPATLRVKPSANNKTVATSFTVYKNGVATPLTVSVPAGSTAMVKGLSLATIFVEGDEIDLRADSLADPATSITFAAMVGYSAGA